MVTTQGNNRFLYDTDWKNSCINFVYRKKRKFSVVNVIYKNERRKIGESKNQISEEKAEILTNQNSFNIFIIKPFLICDLILYVLFFILNMLLMFYW